MEDHGNHTPAGVFIPQPAAQKLLEAAKEAVILMREQKAAFGQGFQGDPQLELLVKAILEAEGN